MIILVFKWFRDLSKYPMWATVRLFTEILCFSGFDHRPFVLNWCMSLKVIDGFVVDPIESLKAEWLYSQGRGRQFRVGEQVSLAKYLSSVCPLTGKALENENERKLRLILSKAQQHQRQLQEEISENSINSLSSSPATCRKKTASRIHSPRSKFCKRNFYYSAMILFQMWVDLLTDKDLRIPCRTVIMGTLQSTLCSRIQRRVSIF